MEKRMFDVLIIGGGVAGMSAAVYAARRGKNVAILEKFALGGVVNTIPHIANFPSQENIDGLTLAQMFAKQVKSFGVAIISDDVISAELSGEGKLMKGKRAEYLASSVIIATGLSNLELGIGEEEYLGRGVSYCAVCDGNFYKNKSVCVASKKGSGLKAAKYLAEICEKVTVLDSEDMSVFAQANTNAKIDVLSNVKILSLNGQEVLQSLKVEVAGEVKEIFTSALFVELGKKPKTQVFDGLNLDAKGFIITDEKMQTNLAGVFAVGDVRAKELRQIVTACSDGAIAGQNA